MQKVDTTNRTVNDMTRLVISRKINQSVIIHENGKVIAEVKLSKVSNKTVKLTFDADETISIDRTEKLNGDLNTHETDLP
mgnify:FL=1